MCVFVKIGFLSPIFSGRDLFNKTNLSKAPKFEMKRIWDAKKNTPLLALQDVSSPIKGTKSHIGQWDQPAGECRKSYPPEVFSASFPLQKWPPTT